MHEIIERLKNEYSYICSLREREIIKTISLTTNIDDLYMACCNIIENGDKIGKKLFKASQVKFFLRKEIKPVFPLWYNEIKNEELKNNLLSTYNSIMEWCCGYNNFINNEILQCIYNMFDVDKVPFFIQVKYFKTLKQGILPMLEDNILKHYEDKELFKNACRELYKKHMEFRKPFLKEKDVNVEALEKELSKFRIV